MFERRLLWNPYKYFKRNVTTHPNSARLKKYLPNINIFFHTKLGTYSVYIRTINTATNQAMSN